MENSEKQIATFTVTVERTKYGVEVSRTNDGLAPHELIGICKVVIAEQMKKVLNSTISTYSEKEMD